MTDRTCIYYGDCQFHHMECEEDDQFFKCPDRKIDKTLIDEIEKYNFECEAGPLTKCKEFILLKERADLWIIVKRGENICHTAGKGGWRFTACTNKDEAQWLADLYNKERYGGEAICTIERFLAVEERLP